MRCKTCDYPLWNLPARKCPECGIDFKPSDFHFVPNSVRFLCPHCLQCYYGTTPEGHLIPRTFSCVTCGQRIDMDEMLLLPAEGVEESRTAADVMPWLQRRQTGWFKGWLRTIGMAMVAPHKLMRAIPLEGGLGEACMFTLITHALITIVGLTIPLLAVSLFVPGGPGGGNALAMMVFGLTSFAGGTFGTLIIALLWGLLTHGLLRISGGTERGLGRTVQALCYSSAANIIMIVPCLGWYCGSYFTWIWWMVSAILMVMEGQKVRGLRATLCVGAGPAVGVVALAGYIALVAVWIGSARTTAAVVGSSVSPVVEARAMHTSIMAYAAAHNGQGPVHTIELVADSYAGASSFVLWQVGHDEVNVDLPGGNISLDEFQYLPPNRMQMTAQAIAQAQPAQVVAHRVGDMVFTYHGMNLTAADPQLWIAILDPDPDQPMSGPYTSMLSTAVLVDGSTIIVSPGTLQQQNLLRTKYGLQPLPDPSTIRSSTPATGTGEGG